jgi:hypothetical protein
MPRNPLKNTIGSVLLAFATRVSEVRATQYYVDCSQSIAGDGSQSSPWNSLSQVNSPTFLPGDIIALKSGTVCTGTLSPKGVGTAASVITITKYSSGGATDNPVINGAGATAAVTLTNQNYWRISSLTVTNPAGSLARRQGIHVTASDGKTHTGITIDGNTVHHVAGQTNKHAHAADFVSSCGILVDIPNKKGRYDKVLVSNNDVSDCGGGGIKVRVGAMDNLSDTRRMSRRIPSAHVEATASSFRTANPH